MIKVVYFGTPQIAVNTLSKLINFNDIDLKAVVTQPDRPCGRGHKISSPPVKVCALKCNLNVYQTSSIRKDQNLIEILKSLEPDFFITFAFGQILSQQVLDIPKIATINLHASQLPKLRGANPIQCAIVQGETLTACTTMITSLGLDEGDICLCDPITIEPNFTSDDLSKIISDKAPFLIYKTIKGLLDKTIVPKKQDNSKATYSCKYNKSDAFIDFSQNAKLTYNKIRGFCSNPCAYFTFKQQNIKITKAKIVKNEILNKQNINHKTFGTVLKLSKQGVVIKTGEDQEFSILLEKIKPPSKGEMDAYCFFLNSKIKEGDILC